MNADDTWTPLLDFADDARWNYWGVDALVTDPVQPNRLYLVRPIFELLGFSILITMARRLECIPTPGTPTMAKS